MARYVTGRGVDDSSCDGGPNGAYGWYGTDSGKEWERNLEAMYVVQSGVAKDLSIRVRHATHRDNFGSDLDEIRVITQYPLNIF